MQYEAIEVWTLEKIKPSEAEMARHSDAEAVKHRGQSMLAQGQLQPVGATRDGRLIYGAGRFLSAKAVGIPTLEVKVYPESTPDADFLLIRAAENIHKNELSGYSKYLLAANLIQHNPSWQFQELATKLNISPGMVTQMLAPMRCTSEWVEALKENKVTLSDCYKAARLEKDKQAGLLNLMLAGGTGEKKPRNPTVRLDRVKIYAGDIQLALSGEGLTLDGVAEALSEAIKEVRRAREQSLDIKTFNACQTAKKGGSK